MEIVLHVISTKLPADSGNSLSNKMNGPVISATRSEIKGRIRFSQIHVIIQTKYKISFKMSFVFWIFVNIFVFF